MTTSEMYCRARDEQKLDITSFMVDMWDAGLEMRYYKGRMYWHGPAVVTDDIQDVLSCTKFRCRWDNLGLSFIVYPVESLDYE